jgi:hypothetical protein
MLSLPDSLWEEQRCPDRPLSTFRKSRRKDD